MFEAYERIINRLTTGGVAFTIHEHTPAYSVHEAEDTLPFPPERFLKTIAFRHKHSATIILAALRGRDRVDYRKLAGLVNLKRSDIVAFSPDEVTTLLGVDAGTIGPIPPVSEVIVVIDKNVDQQETLFCGVGRADRTLEIRLDELLQVSGARVADIAATSPAPGHL